MKTRVLIVDDSPLIRAVLRESFERTLDIEVVGEAGDGRKAIELACELRPDLITMDVMMPVLDGLDATEEIMRVCPTAIVIIARDGGDARSLAIRALGKGALEVFPKPATGFDDDMARELATVIRRVAREARAAVRLSGRLDNTTRTRVLVVDDSAMTRQTLRVLLGSVPDIEVVGEASDGLSAVRLASELRPDVVTLDMVMPMMGGMETAQRILRRGSPGILVLSRDPGAAKPLRDALVDRCSVASIAKPVEGFDQKTAAEVVEAIRRLARTARAHGWQSERRLPPIKPGQVSIIGIVGSTGAPRVLHDLVRDLPADFPVPIVAVQHTERGFAETMAAWLSKSCSLRVHLGAVGHVLGPGEIVIAPDGMHMRVHTGGLVSLQSGEPVNGFRPSGSVLLHSLAETFGQHALGLVLSGMGGDGADGLGAIYAAGGCAVVEDPETAVVPGMPKRALERATGAFVERSSRLALLLIELAGGGRPRPAA
jgi:two-component system chemotaxis response regulator CheB